MTKKLNFSKIMLSALAMGLVFTSCQKEEVINEVETATVELNEPPYNSYLVVTESSTMSKSAEDFLAGSGNVLKSFPDIGVAVVSSDDVNFEKSTLKNKEFASVIPNYIIKWIPTEELVAADANPTSIGDDEPYFRYLWGMDAIDAPEAWNAGYTGSGASVYVLDSGISPTHPDIAPNMNYGDSKSFIEGEEWYVTTADESAHGTHVAGTIAAADNGRGVIGVAPNAEIVGIKVLSGKDGRGPVNALIEGIYYAGNMGADVINMSLGVTVDRRSFILIDADGNEFRIPAKHYNHLIIAQQRAVDYAYKKGSTLIASAGNDPINFDGYSSHMKLPGGLNNVITVSATSPNGFTLQDESSNFDFATSYTTYGRSLIDIAGPGGDAYMADGAINHLDMVLSATPTGWGWMAGTSMAAPHVSGVAALIIGKNGGEMAPHEVEMQLLNTADQVDGNGQSIYFGNGRVNAYRAVTE
ncbi:S8 family peptidase [Salinimicrobium sp. TH3]|uniref:S8 family peptidase n=1 Tax=Salinimicrobium sp. TH3 TaxID=2997342 RepID=UPI0022754C4C|nr:S8 family serine peptidase [Salinimicrobium sp. TH3]MCY2688481.1 S8 family serine peptidase [Salinimicrobium sp. TH3]